LVTEQYDSVQLDCQKRGQVGAVLPYRRLHYGNFARW
jgi:hypothetical protein